MSQDYFGVENCNLADLVEVFLGLTRGFDMPAGSVVLMSSASHAADYVRALGALTGAFAGSLTVLHGIPFLLGGTENMAALRAIAEIGHWIRLTSQGTDTISATRAIFADSLIGNSEHHEQQCILRLPSSQTCTDKCTFISTGFGNVKTAAKLISEDFEKYLLSSLIEELNHLFPMNLATDFICDRYTESDVFDENMMDRTALILIGASHLRNIGRFISQEDWRIFDLTAPGWRISENNVKEKIEELINVASEVTIKTAVCIMQLYDNSIYIVGGPGGVRHLPARNSSGKYHIDGPLIVADKAGVKDLRAKLMPLIKELGDSKKVFLAPLASYWLSPCCDDPSHLVNYREQGYLPKLNSAISALQDCIRDSLYTRRVPNYRVLCPNKLIGLGPRSSGISNSEAKEHVDRWGGNPVHPSAAAYRKMADDIISEDLCNAEARYTNPAKTTVMPDLKRPRVNFSLQRDEWVSGCPAALLRRDSVASVRARGKPPSRGYKAVRGGGLKRGRSWLTRGFRGTRGRGGRW